MRQFELLTFEDRTYLAEAKVERLTKALNTLGKKYVGLRKGNLITEHQCCHLKEIITKNISLIEASRDGDLETVKALLAAGADVHAGNDYALRWSAEYGNLEIVKVMLDAGADVHACKNSALCLATDNGHVEIVKVLLAAGAKNTPIKC